MIDSRRAVLWDLDGTLIDSEECHWLAWKKTLEAEGVEIRRQQFASTFGQRNASFLGGWLGVDPSDERVDRVGAAKEAAFRRMTGEGHCSLMPGAADWLARLRRDGWLQAIASSAPRANVETVLDALGIAGYFTVAVAAEDVRAGKPDPQVFLETASRLALPPARCIVVEDAAAGIEGAHRAAMRSIGVSARLSLPATIRVRSLVDLSPGAFDALLAGR